MERRSDNTPWALKLQEVTLPDAEEGWKAMATILDKEMPTERKKRRRWLLLILLLPLAAVSGYLVWRTPRITSQESPRAGNLPATPGASTAMTPQITPGAGTSAGTTLGTTSRITPGTSRLLTNNTIETEKRTAKNGDEAVNERSELRRSDPGKIVPLGITGPNLRVMSIAHSNDPLKCPPVEKQKESGWVVGVGLNQSIPVNGQQLWTNPSGGLNTWWKDYIPVPFVRYYFQPKIFLQAEARIHAPQFMPKEFWFQYQYNDSMFSNSTFIKELFYFDLPVTIHYAPSPDWSIGLGLQYSHYGKGVTATADSGLFHFYYAGALSEYPMVIVQHNELRGLISVDYTYRHWIIGMSYDEAFTRAISVRVPDPIATPQAHVLYSSPTVRNSSLQLYVRYILWDGRK